MHQKTYPLSGTLPSDRGESDQFIDLERLFTIGARRARVIALCAILGLVLGVLYLIFTPPEYTAVTDVLIDDSLAKYAQDTDNPAPLPSQVDALVLSEVEIMKSERLARTVAAAEKLDRNDAFLNPPQSPVDWAKETVKSAIRMVLPKTPGEEESVQERKMRRAVEILQSDLDVNRVGRSYVIELSYLANDPAMAGEIARAYAKAYLSDQLDANFDATERASIWLQGRIADLRSRSQAAALEVERYRATHGLTAASGELISDQQLSDLNKQLVLAQADTANALARYNQFKAIVDSGPENAVKNATVPSEKNISNTNNAIINELKARYLDITKREQQVAAQFGEDHPQAVALREQQAALAKQIYQELQQLTESYHNEYEVAKAREDSLRSGVGRMANRSTEDDQSMVHLRELEQKSDALSALYKDFLSRHEQALQQGSFPIAKARVISQALDPISPSSPRKVLVLGLSLVLGLFAGAGIGGLQEFRERFFRTGEDVREALDLDFFGYLPAMKTARHARAAAVPDGGDLDLPPILQVATEAPASSFAETLRSAKLGIDIVLQGKSCKVISFLSVLPREGKTTVAANFAELCAASGARTLLIDGDLRNPGLTRSLPIEPEAGLVEAIIGEERWQNVVKVSRRTRLSVLPTVLRGRLSHTSELLSGAGMQNILNAARNAYNYIIVDLPPFGPVVDVKAFEPSIDAFVLVTEWGATPRRLVRSALVSEPRIAAKVLGVVLNKTETKKLGRYGGYGSSERYLDRYSPYYVEPGEAA
ncbi:MAG: chain-length determining protein [Rhizobiales bacterium 65-79]|nr:MAG: chain-length determining protein [Rhizobiales bacterium 65-79]